MLKKIKNAFFISLFCLFLSFNCANAQYSNYQVIYGNSIPTSSCQKIRDDISDDLNKKIYYSSLPRHAVVQLKILKNGTLESYKILNSSNNKPFNDTLISIVKNKQYSKYTSTISEPYVIIQLTYAIDEAKIMPKNKVTESELYELIYNSCVKINFEKLINNRSDNYSFTVKYKINSLGNVVSKQIIKSTNNKDVDTKLLKAIDVTAPYAGVPNGLKEKEFTLSVTKR